MRSIARIGLLLVLLAWAVFPSMTAFYTADDVFFIESLKTEDLAASWMGSWGLRNTLRPLTIFSFWLDGQISGRNPVGFRLTNLALHLACAALLWGILQRFWKDRTALIMSVGYFLLSFTHHESLFWISARTGLLGAVFELLAVFCLVRIGPSRWRTLAVAAAFATSLLCYENALTFPLLISVLYLGWLRPLGIRRDGPAAVSLSLLLAVWVTWAGWLAWRVVALGGVGHSTLR